MAPPPETLPLITDLDGDGRVTDADALQVITRRSAIYHREANKLRSLQEYIRQQLELINGTP